MSTAINKRLYEERKEWGVCVTCGKPLRNGEKTVSCQDCITDRAKYREDNRQHIRDNARDRMNRYRAAGLCVFCGKPVVEGKKLCQYHRDYYSKKPKDKNMKDRPRSLFAQRLIEARTAKGWTQPELAAALGVSSQSVSFWEIDRSYPRMDTLIRLVKLLGVSADWLLGVSDE